MADAARSVALAIAAVAAVTTGVMARNAYLRDMARARAGVERGSTILPSTWGQIEFSEQGAGPAVLLCHGSGGGHDQGTLLGGSLLGSGFRCITPSRFGYLRSSCPETATWDEQANAYAYLLDQLGVERVAVVAVSHGGPSALLFALLHPERVSSLTLVSCGVAASDAPEQASADRRGRLLTALFGHDLPYWAVSRLCRRPLMRLMGASEAVVAGLEPGQRRSVEQFINQMNPASQRTAGVLFDHRTPLPGSRIAGICAPTLILHAVDDTLQGFHNAAFAAATIPGARLMAFDRGGHLLMAVEQAAISEAVKRHVLDHANRPGLD